MKIDATVAPQKIAYPTDPGLLNEAREITEGLVDALGERDKSGTKPRTYRRNARKDFLLAIKKRKYTKKELHKAIGKQLRYLGRVRYLSDLRTIDRLWGVGRGLALGPPRSPSALGGARGLSSAVAHAHPARSSGG